MKMIDLTHKEFGILKAIKYLGGSKWLCRCACGNDTTVFSSNLTRSHTTSCGCIKLIDLAGKKFGRLTVMNRTISKTRGKTKRPMWSCKCDCGSVIDVYGDCLLIGNTQSCGCLSKKKEMPDKIKDDFVESTQLSKIQSKLTKANKTGIVGVNWDKSRNKWQASIRFKGHKYNLGRYHNFDEAIGIRKEAEKKIFGDFISWYEIKNTK